MKDDYQMKISENNDQTGKDVKNYISNFITFTFSYFYFLLIHKNKAN